MYATISDLIGNKLKSVVVSEDDTEIIFTCEDGRQFRMYHEQDCCECVYVESITGNLEDLVGSCILLATDRTNRNENDEDCCDESITWTFYDIATAKGHVSIRWYGASNGYYSEDVDFELIQ